MAKRREFVVSVALSVGASLLPWRLASGASMRWLFKLLRSEAANDA
jgi:hypothetical protein